MGKGGGREKGDRNKVYLSSSVSGFRVRGCDNYGSVVVTVELSESHQLELGAQCHN